LAQEGTPVLQFARPKMDGLDFSFSGLKTSVLYTLRKELEVDPDYLTHQLPNICASIQQAIVDILLHKLGLAVKQTGIKQIAIAGGVAANSGLRSALNQKEESANWSVYTPRLAYCTDNAAMIGVTAHYKFLAGEFSNQEVEPSARL